MSGWIKIHRDFQRHWIAQDFTKLGWWVDLLFLANSEDSRTLIGNRLVDVKRGQMVISYSSLAKRWRSTKSVVVSFISLLEANTMIERYIERKLTILTICNYDSYILENEHQKNDVRTISERCANDKHPISIQSLVQLSDCESKGYKGCKNDSEPMSERCVDFEQESPLFPPSSFSPTPPYTTPPIIPQEKQTSIQTYAREENPSWDAEKEQGFYNTFKGLGSAVPMATKTGKSASEIMKLLDVYMAHRQLKNLGHSDYQCFVNLFSWHIDNNKISLPAQPVEQPKKKVKSNADFYKEMYG